MQTFLVDENSRLDVFLAKKLNQSRNQVALLIEKDCVQVNDKIQDKNSFKLKNGDIVSIASLKLCNEIKPQFEVDFDIDVFYNRIIIDAKSILGVLSLDLSRELTVKYGGQNMEFEDILSKYATA